MSLAIAVGLLVAGATFLVLTRGMVRLVLGFVVLSHGANLAIFAAGGTARRDPAIGEVLDTATTADPLPQAFVLTAIVIAFAVTVFMLVLAVVGGDDDDTDASPGEPVRPEEPDEQEPEEREEREDRDVPEAAADEFADDPVGPDDRDRTRAGEGSGR